MKLLSPAQMQKVDERASTEYKIPSLLLMEHAAHAVFEYLKENYLDQSIIIVCGPGNNGGDGLALARLLVSYTKCKVEVWMLASPEQLSKDGQVYYEICKQLSVQFVYNDTVFMEIHQQKLSTVNVIVDALFGTGISRPIEGNYKKMIEAINRSEAHIVSIDIPSGIDGLTGKLHGIGVCADITITFMVPKIGLFLYPGITYTGEVKVVNIGIPMKLIEEVPSHVFSIEAQEMKSLLPKRWVRSNKGTYGKVLTVGGSLGMAGAITLTSLAAYKAGCGTVTMAVPRRIIEIVQQKLTEAMAIPMQDEAGFFSNEAARDLEDILSRYDVIAIGPGMGRNSGTLELLKVALKSDKPCVIDADALYFVPQVLKSLKNRKAPTVLTPHPGELSRMIDCPIKEILETPIEVSQKFAQELGVILLLKIEKTVIADWSGNIYINRCGNSGLAKGGSGDTLTGIIAGLLAQHMQPIDAARLGVYLQTRAADITKDELSQYSYLASDTIGYISRVYHEMQ